MNGVICGTGSSVPLRIMNNNDIAKLVETSDEWIRERTGVEKRHVITEETTVSLAADAGLKALRSAGIRPDEIDLILVATISSDVVVPCTACEVQRILGAVRATCFDLSAACCGFVFAYNTAAAYLNMGIYHTALVIGSESLSRLVNWKDRGTCILFGDGAGAAVVRQTDGTPYLPVTHSEGACGAALSCKSRLFQESGDASEETYYLQMDGREVFRFAVRKVPEVITEVLEKNGVPIADIDYFIIHQANRRIIEAVAKRLGEPIDKFPMNLQNYGNTSSASIPILLDELYRSGTLKKGQKIVMAGFGAGLSWGAAILDWQI